MEENRQLKIKMYEYDRRFRIYEAFLASKDDVTHHDNDGRIQQNNDDYNNDDNHDNNTNDCYIRPSKVDLDEDNYIMRRYHEDNDDDYSYGHDDNDNNDDRLTRQFIKPSSITATTTTRFDDSINHKLMKLRNLHSFHDNTTTNNNNNTYPTNYSNSNNQCKMESKFK